MASNKAWPSSTLPPLPTDPASYTAYMKVARSQQDSGLNDVYVRFLDDPLRRIEGARTVIRGLRMEERLHAPTLGSEVDSLKRLRSKIDEMKSLIESISQSLPLNLARARPDETQPLQPLIVNLPSQARNATIRLNSVPEYGPLFIVVQVAPKDQPSGVVPPRSDQVPYSIAAQLPNSLEVTVDLNPLARSDDGRGQRSRKTARRPDEGNGGRLSKRR